MLFRHEVWTATISLLPCVSAFYPYHYGDSGPGNHARRRAVPPTPTPDARRPRIPLTLPLRRTVLSSRQNKYTIVDNSDPEQENSVAVDQDGKDLSYMVAVTLGSNKEEYHLLLDSAASNTWIMGNDCDTDACQEHNTFGKGDSDTLQVRTDVLSSMGCRERNAD